MNKASVHVTQPGNTKGLGEFLRIANESGRTVPVIYSLNGNLKDTINRYSPKTKIIYRRQSDAFPRLPPNFFENDPVVSATNYLTRTKDKNDQGRTQIQNWALNPADYYDALNEPSIDLPPNPTDAQIQDAIRKAQWLNTWMYTAIDIAAANGFKLALFSFPTGSPSMMVWSYLFPSMRKGRFHGSILSLHEYSVTGTMQDPSPGNVLRYREVWDLLPDDCKMPIVITESGAGNGYDTGLSGQAFVDDQMWYNGQLCQDDCALGFCSFQLGGNESNMKDAMEAYTMAVSKFTCDVTTETESSDGTTIPPDAKIVDSSLAVWTFGDSVPMGRVILKNGSQFGGGQGNLLLYFGKRVYTRNADNEWYIAGDVWERVPGDPRFEKILNVPWVGQNTIRPDDDRSKSDCGPAVVCQWLRYRGVFVSVDDVSIATGLPAGFKYTSFYNLDTASNKFGLNLKYQLESMTQGAIKAEIDAGRPCIVLAHYPSLPVKWDNLYTFNHWILIVGYNSSGFYYHDPYWPDERGERMFISSSQLAVAMANVSMNGNVPNQGIVEQLTPQNTGTVAIRSVHGRADGGQLRSIDIQAAKTSPLINGYKMYQNAMGDYSTLADNGFSMANILVRLDHVKDRRVDARFYINDQNTGIWDLPIREARDAGVTWVEPFNEVNIGAEGLGVAWSSPEDFCELLKSVVSKIKSKYPTMKILSTAMSPQPNTQQWWSAMNSSGVFSMVDGYAAHSYWDSENGAYPMNSESGGTHYRGLFRYLISPKKISLTEVSNNANIDSDAVKGQQYARYLKSMETDKIARVDFFCVSASDPAFNNRRETWVRSNSISDIPINIA